MNKKTYLKKPYLILAGAIICATGINSQAATPTLAEFGFKVDTSLWDSIATPGDLLPSQVDISGFNLSTGLGSISFSITGGGSHYFSSFLDLEIEQILNPFFNEVGTVSGLPASGQTWEIDEPGWSIVSPGDIYANFSSGALDGTVGKGNTPDDVSVAMGWDFSLQAWQTATIVLNITETAPSGFYLKQTDVDSQDGIYYSGSLDITGTRPPDGGGTGVPDGGSTLAMLTSALAAMGAWRSRRK